MLKTILKKIGLSEKNAEIYLACLELGSKPASIIAKKAGVHREAVYVILKELIHKGLVNEHQQGKIKYFTAVAPEYLLHFTQKKERQLQSNHHELEQYLPQFLSLSNSFSGIPKIRLYEGQKGLEMAMNDTLTSKEPLRNYCMMDAWFTGKNTTDFIFWYGKQRVYRHELPIRSVNLDSAASRRYLEKEYPEIGTRPTLSHFRWLPKGTPAFFSETNIYGNKISVAYIGKHEIFGMIIESAPLAELQKTIFDATWHTHSPARWELNPTSPPAPQFPKG